MVVCSECKYYVPGNDATILQRLKTEDCSGPIRLYFYTYFRKIDVTRPAVKNCFGTCKDFKAK